ncbi:MAG: VWA domain-containing protein [Planctomycetota bacterium]
MNAVLEGLSGLRLLAPWWGVLALLWLGVAWHAWRRRPRATAFAASAVLDGAPQLPRSWRARLVALPAWLHGLGVLLAIVALAQPARRVALPVVHEGVDLLLCLDVSSSMATADPGAATSRLELARAAAAEFVQQREHDRIGLCAFARYPDLLCPPTLDHAALLQLLQETRPVPRDAAEDATGIGTAVARSVQALQHAESPSRAVVLVTDGDENVASAGAPREIGPLQAAQLAAQQGVRVYALAVGAAAELDTTQIEQLALRTGGRLFRAADPAAMRAVWSEIDRLERAPLAAPRWRFEERHAPFVLAALLAIAAGWVLRRSALEVVA